MSTVFYFGFKVMSSKNIKRPTADKTLQKRIENIKRKKIVSEKVVSLTDFRDLKKQSDNRNILVVDDDEVMRSVLKRILEAEGYSVILAEDGLQLSKILENTNLDLILLDVNLPWVNGYELCQIVKDHSALKHVPVVMVSAQNSQEDIEKGFESGANDYVTKPFDVDFIMETISKTIRKSS